VRVVILLVACCATLPQTAAARPRLIQRLRAVRQAAGTEALRLWRNLRHSRARGKVQKALHTLDRVGLHTKAPINLVSNAERQLHGSLIREARMLRGARPGTMAYRRLKVVQRRLAKLSAKRRLTRTLPSWASAETNGKSVTVNIDRIGRSTLVTLAHELRHVKDRKGHPQDFNEKELVVGELRAHRAEGYVLGASGRPLRALHFRSPTGDAKQDARYPPVKIGKATAHGYIIGVKRSLEHRYRAARPGARKLANAYLRGYRDALLGSVRWSAKNPVPKPPEGKLTRLGQWLSFQKFRAARALKTPGHRWKQRSQSITTVEQAKQTGQRDAWNDLSPLPRARALLSR
jgi:hypothetical protein